MSPRSNETARRVESRLRNRRLGEISVRIRQVSTLAFAAAMALPLAAHAGTPGISETFDGVTAPALPDGWTTLIATGAASDLPWATRDVDYADSTPNAVWIDDVNDYADISLNSPTYSLPAATAATITFHHSYVLWAPDDSALANGVFNGGVLEVSINGGAFQDLLTAGGAFIEGGYNVQLDPGFDSPLAQPPALDRSVWGGTSADFVTTTATLPAAAQGGTIALRWRLGSEGGGRSYATHSGWWIDDFACDQCQLAPDDTIFKNGFDGTP